MTSVKQIAANRRNASQSSGPRTEKARTAPAAMQCVMASAPRYVSLHWRAACTHNFHHWLDGVASTKGEIHQALDKLSHEKGHSVKDTTNRKEPERWWPRNAANNSGRAADGPCGQCWSTSRTGEKIDHAQAALYDGPSPSCARLSRCMYRTLYAKPMIERHGATHGNVASSSRI
jgi:hypothetical protein